MFRCLASLLVLGSAAAQSVNMYRYTGGYCGAKSADMTTVTFELGKCTTIPKVMADGKAATAKLTKKSDTEVYLMMGGPTDNCTDGDGNFGSGTGLTARIGRNAEKVVVDGDKSAPAAPEAECAPISGDGITPFSYRLQVVGYRIELFGNTSCIDNVTDKDDTHTYDYAVPNKCFASDGVTLKASVRDASSGFLEFPITADACTDGASGCTDASCTFAVLETECAHIKMTLADNSTFEMAYKLHAVTSFKRPDFKPPTTTTAAPTTTASLFNTSACDDIKDETEKGYCVTGAIVAPDCGCEKEWVAVSKVANNGKNTVDKAECESMQPFFDCVKPKWDKCNGYDTEAKTYAASAYGKQEESCKELTTVSPASALRVGMGLALSALLAVFFM